MPIPTLTIVILDVNNFTQLGADFEQNVLEQIHDLYLKTGIAFNLRDQLIVFEKAANLDSYLGCPTSEVLDLARLSNADIVGMQDAPRWLCMTIFGFHSPAREILCSRYIINRWSNDEMPDCKMQKPRYPVFLQKGEPEKRYVFVQAADPTCMVSLLADLLEIYVLFFQDPIKIFTSDTSMLEQFRERMRMIFPIEMECNFLPLCCCKDFKTSEVYIDLNYPQAPSCLEIQSSNLTLLFNRLTPMAVATFANYKHEIEDINKFDTRYYYALRRLGALTPSLLHNNKSCITTPQHALFLRHWEELGQPPCDEHGYSDGPDGYLITKDSTPGLTDMLLAAMNFAIANPKQKIEEISLQVIYADTDSTLLYTNLLGTMGYMPMFAPELMVKLVPELNVSLLSLPFDKEVEIRVYIYQGSAQNLDDSEVFRRLMAFSMTFVSNYLGALVDKNLIKICYSQIQARNFSHNIGSHALLKFKKDIEVSICQIDRVLRYLAGTTDHNREKSFEVLDKVRTMLDNLHRGYDYIAEKGRYLASFALTDNNFVWHSMTAHKFYQRLNDFNYVFNSLTDRDGFTVNFSLLVNGIPVSRDNDLEISMPEAGEFALFNIVENIVRNAVKHEELETNRMNLVLAFEENQQYIVLQIYRVGACYNKVICDQLNNYIREAVVDPYTTTQLNIHNLGVKEMRAAVLYLNGLLPGDEEFEQQLPHFKDRHTPLLEACQITVGGKPKDEWGYKFHLTRHNRVLVVTDNEDQGLPSGWGADCITIKDALTARRTVRSHDFLVYSATLTLNQIQSFESNVQANFLPQRKVVINLQQLTTREKLYCKIWEEYTRNNYLKSIQADSSSTSLFKLIDRNGNGSYPYSYNHAWKENTYYYYSDALSSRLQFSSPLFRNLNNSGELTGEEKLINKCKIVCYTTLAVCILDERIQHLLFERSLLEKWKRMLIFAPDKICGRFLDEIKDIEEIMVYLDSFEHPLANYGFGAKNVAIILHESLLQRWLGSKNVRPFLSKLQEKEYSVYLTTGRGRAQYLTDKTRFLPFNRLLGRIEEGDKYGLYNLLMGARI